MKRESQVTEIGTWDFLIYKGRFFFNEREK